MGHLDKLIVSGVKLFSSINKSLLLNIERLELEAGIIYGLVGKNLSGRSALLRLIGGGFLPLSDNSEPGRKELLWSNSGEITEFDSSKHSIYLGPNPTDSLSTLTSTVQDELILHCKTGSINSSINNDRHFTDLTALLRLDKCSRQNPMQLSGGQTAALTLACAIELDRLILCIDEALEHLDIELSHKAWNLLKKFANQGKIIIVADNKYDLMGEYVERVILLNQMQVKDVTSPRIAFNISGIKEQDTIPTVTRLAEQIYKNKCTLPIEYKELREILSQALNINQS